MQFYRHFKYFITADQFLNTADLLVCVGLLHSLFVLRVPRKQIMSSVLTAFTIFDLVMFAVDCVVSRSVTVSQLFPCDLVMYVNRCRRLEYTAFIQ